MRPTARHRLPALAAALAILAGLAFPPGDACAQVPRRIAYQGYLANAAGVPVDAPAATPLTMVFRLYPYPVGGGAVHEETQQVTVKEGVFNVHLGDAAALTAPFDTTYWLGVTVGMDSEMTPRQPLAASPYALRAASLESSATIAASQITGTITLVSATGSAAQFGTSDGQPADVIVNSQRVMRYAFDPSPSGSSSPNILGGYTGNSVAAGVHGATLAGGGSYAYENAVQGHYGTVSGGQKNRAVGEGSVVSGGRNNLSGSIYVEGVSPGADHTTVAGGFDNQATGPASTVGGGFQNIASGYIAVIAGGDLNDATGQNATIGGGYDNTASGANATVAGGVFNEASGFGSFVAGHSNRAAGEHAVALGFLNEATGIRSTISGGMNNKATAQGATVGGGGMNPANQALGNEANAGASTISGGYGNVIDSFGFYGTIAGGQQNRILAPANNVGHATIGGGLFNTVSLGGGTIGGGNSNTAGGFDSTVGGGINNTASGGGATVPGGSANTAAGAYSFAAGYRAKALNNGCFAWADNTDADFSCTTNNAFIARASGGVHFYTNAALTTGCSIGGGGGSWSCTSSRDEKTDFAPVDPLAVLARVAALPVSEWRYRDERSRARHVGPMAQDFHAAFGLGDDDRSIGLVDVGGVALAAIQGLERLVRDKDRRIADLEARASRMERLERELDAIKAKLGLR
jgi:hypothetical protein